PVATAPSTSVPTGTPAPTGTVAVSATLTAVTTATSIATTTPTRTPLPSSTPTVAMSATAVSSSGSGGSSLALNGTTTYAEAPHAAELSGVGDWTIEAWFKDENPTYNHPRARILTKGDISSAAGPLFA